MNEEAARVYRFETEGGLARDRRLEVDFEAFGLEAKRWGNAGLEGVAYDAATRRLYLAKERQPRFLLEFQLDENHRVTELLSKFDFDPLRRGALDRVLADYSDLFFEGGFLYVLERRDLLVAKVDVRTKKVVARVDYRVLRPDGEGLYRGSTLVGMAEALLLTPYEIWIGFDNGRKEINAANRWAREFQLGGSESAIARFRRPAGF